MTDHQADVTPSQAGTTPGQTDIPPINERIRLLFLVAVDPDTKKPYTTERVASATGLSTATVSRMRQGDAVNPQHESLTALQSFFGVPPAYFFDTADTATIYAEIKALHKAAELGVKDVVLRSDLDLPLNPPDGVHRRKNIDPRVQAIIFNAVEQILKLVEQDRQSPEGS